MAYIVNIKRSAEKELDNLPAQIHGRIIDVLLSLKEDPLPSGSKILKGREGYRIRVGDYRILYVISSRMKIVEIFSIAHRKDVYRL